ncbi:MAG: hypothetical protein H7831_11245, partial [Magnetococcus sp. WYHC-3]
ALCALGLSQWHSWPRRRQRRLLLEDVYRRRLRGDGLWTLPTVAAPRWWRGVDDDAPAMAAFHRWHRCALALPRHGGLSDADQKRIINRLHRWVGRQHRGMGP